MPPTEMPRTTASDPWLADRVALTQRPAGRPVMHQRWHDLLFLHWEVPVDALTPLLPPGLEVDTHEGRAYVGLVPFGMAGVRPRGLPSVRGLSDFPETNVRTYVRRPDGMPGVWFFTLDAGNLVGAFLGRHWFHLPYHHARMSLDARDGSGPGSRWLRYESSRLGRPAQPGTTRIEAEATGPITPAEPGSLPFFLAERYLLYAPGRRAGSGLLRGRVHHRPYPLQPAGVARLDESLLAACGIARPATTPLAHYARAVTVEVFPLEAVRGAGRPEGEPAPGPPPFTRT